ncbi:MAG: hypothetical protein LQ340_003732 [Diploschistes diacapsis]|nr:MAG: hypothetical protein LQ340_003732 [Diploschistes diacapsis]
MSGSSNLVSPKTPETKALQQVRLNDWLEEHGRLALSRDLNESRETQESAHDQGDIEARDDVSNQAMNERMKVHENGKRSETENIDHRRYGGGQVEGNGNEAGRIGRHGYASGQFVTAFNPNETAVLPVRQDVGGSCPCQRRIRWAIAFLQSGSCCCQGSRSQTGEELDNVPARPRGGSSGSNPAQNQRNHGSRQSPTQPISIPGGMSSANNHAVADRQPSESFQSGSPQRATSPIEQMRRSNTYPSDLPGNPGGNSQSGQNRMRGGGGVEEHEERVGLEVLSTGGINAELSANKASIANPVVPPNVNLGAGLGVYPVSRFSSDSSDDEEEERVAEIEEWRQQGEKTEEM